MDNGDSLGSGCDQPFDALIIYLQRVGLRLAKDGYQSIFRNRQDRGDIGIGRHNDLIARLHDAHLDIGTEDPDECIKAVGTTDGILGSDKRGVVGFKLFVLLALEVPSPIDNP